MAATYKVVTGVVGDTTTEAKDFTSAGFGTVTAAIVFISDANSTNNPQDGLGISIGFWNGTNQRLAAMHSDDNLDTSNTGRFFYATLAGGLRDNTTIICDYTISNITDGVRLTMGTDNTTVERYATVILFGGTSAGAAGSATINNTQDATTTVSGLAFAPDIVFFTCCGCATNTASNAGLVSFGVAVNDGSATQRCMLFGALNGAGTSVTNRRLETDSVCGQLYSDALAYTAEVTSFTGDGFVITTRDGASGSDVTYYLAIGLDGDSAWLGTLTTPTSTGNDSITAPGLQPELAILCGHDTAANNTSAHLTMMLGASDGTTHQTLAGFDEDGVGTTDSASEKFDNILNMVSATDGADDVVAALVSFDATGRTYNYTTVNAAARYGWELLMGSPSAGTTAPWHRNMPYGFHRSIGIGVI